MKNIIYLLLLCSSYLNAQIDTFFLQSNDYGVFCFQDIEARTESTSADSSQFLIRFIEPQFEKEIIHISYSDLDSTDIENGFLELVVKPKHSRYFRYELYEGCLDSKKGMCFYQVHEQAFSKRIMLDSLIQKDIPIEIFSLVSNGKIEKELLQKAPNRIRENEIYFAASTWSGLRQMACCLIKRSTASIKEIEEALFERGYAVIFNDKLDSVEKYGLTHFQKENGFPVGNLNMETLRALGLQY